MSTDTVIRVNNVWKRYGFPLQAYSKQQFDKMRGQYTGDLSDYGPWALQDISFEVKKGDSLGIVGKNGAGKSTLLKLLAGVSPPTHGSIEVYGRLFPMIELAAGMHRDLTGRENIRLLGSIMGFDAQEMDAKMPEIEDFSELGEWLDQPVWQYSSGMEARLGFSVAVNVEADILLIDEVLSVGDVNFRKKCLSRMDTLVSSGVTILFVTHNPYSIERICNQAIYLNKGRITESGHPTDILTAYFHQSIDKPSINTNSRVNPPDLRPGTGVFRIMEVAMLSVDSSEPIDSFNTGDSVKVQLDIAVKEPVETYSLSIRILDSASTIIAFIDIPRVNSPALALNQDGYLECIIENINLLPGEYWFEFVAKELGGVVIDNLPYALPFAIYGNETIFQETNNRGFVHLPTRWNLVTHNETMNSSKV